MGKKKAITSQSSATQSSATHDTRSGQGRRKQTQIGKLADEALAALDGQNVKQAREIVRAIRGIARSAENDQLDSE